jgi:hypothetical protein
MPSPNSPRETEDSSSMDRGFNMISAQLPVSRKLAQNPICHRSRSPDIGLAYLELPCCARPRYFSTGSMVGSFPSHVSYIFESSSVLPRESTI